MARERRLSRAEARVAVLDCGVLAIACLVTYGLATYLLSRIHSESRTDDMLGGLWAVIATVFVCRLSYDQSTTAAVSRVAATSVSFVLCLILPDLPAVPPLGAGGTDRSQRTRGHADRAARRRNHGRDHHGSRHGRGGREPARRLAAADLRFADTVIGVAVGVAAAWAGLRVIRRAAWRAGQPGGAGRGPQRRADRCLAPSCRAARMTATEGRRTLAVRATA